MADHTLHIKEFGKIEEANKSCQLNNSYAEISLSKDDFESLTNFIEENSYNSDFSKAFTIFSRSGKRYIQVKNFVGVIETNTGLVIEILPKVFNGKTQSSKDESKLLLLKMLRVITNIPFINLDKADLQIQDNFPILEVFITSFIKETEFLLSKELNGEYNVTEDYLPYVKGKIVLNTSTFSSNFIKTKFNCRYDDFNNNIPPNKLIKSTLLKLFQTSKSSNNKKIILKLLSHFDEIDISTDFIADFEYSNARKFQFKKYDLLIRWCEVFLLNKSFMNFHGKSVNQAILYPMEKLFEEYVAHLLRKYCDGVTIKTQERKYFLLGQKSNSDDSEYSIKRFALKPDIVLDKGKVIIDTKWKLLNMNSRNFDIKESDIYQMHAYGRKYTSELGVATRLALIYPRSEYFSEPLLQFSYGDNITLDIIPINLLSSNLKEELNNIVSVLNYVI